MFLIIYILLLTARLVSTEENIYPDRNCKFKYKLKFGQKIAIESPKWPANYKPGLKCRWMFECPVNYKCLLFCYDVSLPESVDCYKDKLLVSREGGTQFSDPEIYCGTTVFSSKSVEQRITLGLLASKIGHGGRFRCQVSPEWGRNAYLYGQ